jgi:hypothetical protein
MYVTRFRRVSSRVAVKVERSSSLSDRRQAGRQVSVCEPWEIGSRNGVAIERNSMPEERSRGHVGTDATRIYQRSVTEPPGLLQKLALLA